MRLETERLLLREWRDADRTHYAEIIADPEVRRFFLDVGTRADADVAIDRAMERLREVGYGFLAVERKSDASFIGMLGMAPFSDTMRLTISGPASVEIGWQLGRSYWGQGYAPEGGRAMLDHAWRVLALPGVVAITYEGNWPSRRVMEKLGMAHDPTSDFLHPDIPEGHPLRPHVVYRIANPALRE